MKTIFSYWWILLFVIGFFYLAETTISIRPFKISMEKPFTAVGWILLVISLSLIVAQERITYKKKARQEVLEELHEEIKQIEELKSKS